MAQIICNGKRLFAEKGQRLIEVLVVANIRLTSLCGGRGLCGKCRVIVRKGKDNINPVTAGEKKLLTVDEIKKGYRLACLCEVTNDGLIRVDIPYQSLIGHQRLLTSGKIFQVKVNPAFKKVFLKIKHPTLNDVRSDRDRMLDAIKNELSMQLEKFDYNVLKEMPNILRKSDWNATIGIWDEEEIISIEEGNTENKALGFAVDIGTTKLAGYLVDLNSGNLLVSSSSMNPQIPFGEDVVSRITFVSEGESNLNKLHEALIDRINQLIKDSCNKANVKDSDIYDVVVAGNTAMQQIFLNITPMYLAKSPFTAVSSRAIDVKAEKIGVRITKGGYIHVLPQIAGFVGGDAIADIIATKLNKIDETSLLIDVGTNAEIILGNRRGLLACSCASGPAFEGAHIKYGVRATDGAIERLWINPKTRDVTFHTIGGSKPIGMCGSAIVDAVSEMFINGLVDGGGRIKHELNHKRMRKTGKSYEFIIAFADETTLKKDITVTQADIREIQLAKAAIYAGVTILMKHLKLRSDDIRKLFLAGAFGTYVDPQSIRSIGMIPDIPLDRIEFVGNTAGAGARLALISKEIRMEAENIIKRIKYIELAADPNFQDKFISSMSFHAE